MSDTTSLQHRRFMTQKEWATIRLKRLQGGFTNPPPIVAGTIHAIQMTDSKWTAVDLVQRVDQPFSQHATPWEKKYCLPLQKNRRTPVIDAEFVIVGYIGSIRGDHLWVPWDYDDDRLFLGLAQTKPQSVFDGNIPIRTGWNRPSDQWRRLATCDDSYMALQDIHGNVLALLSHELRSNAVSVGLGPIEYISIGKLGLSILKGLSKRLMVKAGEKGLRTIALRLAQRLARSPSPAQARLLRTQINLRNQDVIRTVETLRKPMVYRHTITSEVKFASYAQIKKGGHLNLSKGANAHYGEGVYVWPAAKKGVGKYIDIEVKVSTGVEKIVTKNNGHWFRLVPPEGNKLSVKIVGHNFSKEELKYAERLINE